MFYRVIFYSTLLFAALFYSNCSSQPSQQLWQKSFKKLIQENNYSKEGFNKITTIYYQHPNIDIVSRLNYYYYISVYYRLNQNYVNAIIYADSMLAIVNKPGYEKNFFTERVRANIAKADVYYANKQFENCYYYYCIGNIEAGKVHNSALTQDLYERLSMFLYEEGNYPKAIYYYKHLLENVTGINKTYAHLARNQGIFDNIGISFLKNKNADSSIFYLNKAIGCVEEARRLQPALTKSCQAFLGIIYGNLAQAYEMKGNNRMAEEIYKKSIAINSQPGYESENALITQQQLADLYYKKKDFPLLYTTLQAVQKGLDTVPNHNVETQWNYLMSRYYVAKQMPAKAFSYLEAYLKLKDTNIKSLKTESETDIFDQMNLMQAKYDVNLLQKNNQFQEMYLWIVSILSLLVLVIAFLIFNNLKKSKKHVLALTDFNNKIQSKQRQLEEMLAELKRQNIEKKHILHVVAHDLRNPLSVVQSLATVIENEYENEDENREYLDIIKSCCTESNQLINGILEIAESAEVKYNHEPVNIDELLLDNVQVMSIRAKEKNQTINFETPEENTLIEADSEKINRVFSNLITNAIKFSPSGSYINVSSFIKEDYIIIKIKDDGIGIPEKYQNDVFTAFTDARRAGTDGEKTFGLGLSISKQIIENHNGRIWFDSMENKGTTFYIQLPKLKETTAQAVSLQSAKQG